MDNLKVVLVFLTVIIVAFSTGYIIGEISGQNSLFSVK